MRGRISGLSTLCKRFAAILRRCDVETFLNIGRIFLEIAPLEKRIDMHIDLLRRDEFRDMECVSDVAKYVLNPWFIFMILNHLESKPNSTTWQKLTLMASNMI